MSIHKTKFGTYEVRWRLNGKQKAKGFKKKIDAEKFEAGLTLDIVPDESKTTFEELAQIWLDDYALVHKSPSAIIRDKQILRDYLLPDLGKIKLSQIQPKHIVEIQSKLHKRGILKPKSINNITGLCHKIFSDGIYWGYLKTNPAVLVKPIKLTGVDYNWWTFDERDKFLAYAKMHNYRVYRVVCFAVNTGLRRGEVEGLLRDCLDFHRREIVVKRNFCHKTMVLNEYTKSKQIRRVPMNSDVYDLLLEYQGYDPKQRIFKEEFQNFCIDRFYPTQGKAGVQRITFHDLRHTFASMLAMSGLSVFDIQMLLGHSDLKTTMRYMHLAPGHLRGKTDVLIRTQTEKNFASELCHYSDDQVQKAAIRESHESTLEAHGHATVL
ncbi:MAG TPA: site-specific integrase [Oligoflexus sp.]|nr:site-specific integrase [Oligoflexus sp.]